MTIQMNPLQQYFHMVLFVLYVVLTFGSVGETLYDVTIQKKPLQQYFHIVLFVLRAVLTFESHWTTETIQTKPLFCFTYACQADFEFTSLVSLQNNNVTQTSSSCCSSRFTVS